MKKVILKKYLFGMLCALLLYVGCTGSQNKAELDTDVEEWFGLEPEEGPRVDLHQGRSAHWVGNINVLMNGVDVERHEARAFRIYPEKVNRSWFLVFLPRNLGYTRHNFSFSQRREKIIMPDDFVGWILPCVDNLIYLTKVISEFSSSGLINEGK